MDSRRLRIAERGITLPEGTREQLRQSGIFCRSGLQVVFQQQTRGWAIRGEESGGAVALMGHYVGFTAADGSPVPWLQRIQNFMPNGLHAVVVRENLCRVEMFRYEHTYDLLITHHSLVAAGRKRPQLKNEIVFFRRAGSLATELWGRDSAFRGGAAPRFFQKSGDEILPPATFLDAVLKITDAVCSVGCKQPHLLELGIPQPEEIGA